MARVPIRYDVHDKELNSAIRKTRRLDKETDKLRKGIDRTGKQAKRSTSRMGGQFVSLGNIIKGAGVLGAVHLLNRAFRDSIKTAADFELQMAKARAVTGATGAEFSKLEESAKLLGRTTFFTASQVGQLQLAYGKLGFATKEILAASEATLQLAVATDEELGRAAEVAGSTVRAFRLEATETQRVVDVMAASFTSSALDMEKFSEAMKLVAPVAAAGNISLEATTEILAKLADRGIAGSLAGTALRSIFIQLTDPTSDLAKALGFVVNDTESLQKAFAELTSREIDLAEASGLVERRQIAALTAVLGTMGDLTESFDEAAGAGKRMSDIVGDTLSGDFKGFQSALEGVQIALLESDGLLRDLTQGGTNFLNALTDWIGGNKEATQTLSDLNDQFNIDIRLLTEGNISAEARNELIDEMNTRYGDYLPNLISEKDSLEDIKKAQDDANDAFKEAIFIRSTQEAQEDLLKREAKARIALIRSEIALERIREEGIFIMQAETAMMLFRNGEIEASNKLVGELTGKQKEAFDLMMQQHILREITIPGIESEAEANREVFELLKDMIEAQSEVTEKEKEANQEKEETVSLLNEELKIRNELKDLKIEEDDSIKKGLAEVEKARQEHLKNERKVAMAEMDLIGARIDANFALVDAIFSTIAASSEASVGLLVLEKAIAIAKVLILLQQEIAAIAAFAPPLPGVREAYIATQVGIAKARAAGNVATIIGTAIPQAISISNQKKKEEVRGFAEGTMSVEGGQRGRDSVHALLEPEEAVIPVNIKKKYEPILSDIFHQRIKPELANSMAMNGGSQVINNNGVDLSDFPINEWHLTEDGIDRYTRHKGSRIKYLNKKYGQ